MRKPGARINRVKFNEMAVAEAQIAKVRETIGGKFWRDLSPALEY